MRLRAKFSLYLGIPLILAFVLLTVIVIYESQKSVTNLYLDASRQIVAARAEEVAKWAGSKVAIVERSATEPEIASGDQNSTRAYLGYRADHLAAEADYEFCADAEGAFWTSAGASGSVADRAYFAQIMQHSAAYVIDNAVLSKATGKPIVNIVSAVKETGGKPRGLYGVAVSLDVLSSIAGEVKLGKEGYGLIIDGNLLLIAHPDEKLRMKVSFADPKKLGYKGLEPAVERIRNGESGQQYYLDDKGIQKIIIFAPVAGTPGWSFGVILPAAQIRSESNALGFLLAIVSTICLVILVGATFVIVGRIAEPVGLFASTLRVVASGDLGLAGIDKAKLAAITKRRDELGDAGRATAEFVSKLGEFTASVKQAAANVSSGSQDISSTSQEMSQGATEQAASAEEVSASLEEATSTTHQNADNAIQTEAIAEKAATGAEQAGSSVNEAVGAMKEIASRISIIEEIARQTNLLALNAAIEAARAGEAGKGFAVVASEVRKLAERSQQAASEISKLSVRSTSVADRAGGLVGELLPAIKKTADLVREISAASAEQKSGMDQISKAISQLDNVIQANASASEELAGMSEELAAQAVSLASTASYFHGETATADEGSPEKADTRRPRAPAPAAHRVERKSPPAPRPSTAIKPRDEGKDKTDEDFEVF
jgi:methyl-accepting chemotaxis protein